MLDACALVPIVQADTLLRLAEAELYRPLWSDLILEETQRAIEKIHPDLEVRGLARRRVEGMNETFEDANVNVWANLYAAIDLPDPDDRHVVAAAIQGRADLIVTNNRKDFPEEALRHLDLSTQTPDEFLLNQLDLDPRQVMLVLAEQADATKKPSSDCGRNTRKTETVRCRKFCRRRKGAVVETRQTLGTRHAGTCPALY